MTLHHGVCCHAIATVWGGHHRRVIPWADQRIHCQIETRNSSAQALVFTQFGNSWHQSKVACLGMKNLRRALVVLVTATLSATLMLSTSACSATVPLESAEFANSYACAEFSVRLPDEIELLPKRTTDAQATAAWGDPTAVIARCGLPKVTVSQLRCITAAEIDWLVDESKAPVYRFISFGRNPATEIIVDSRRASGASALEGLSDAVAKTPQTVRCSG